ncbi:MFS transporter [Streptomyces sp. NPDC057293]|uniref:MFS transporter n=1 Tax=unclassified Streptomyces TaxID=2593676 RepID=UPI00363A1F12
MHQGTSGGPKAGRKEWTGLTVLLLPLLLVSMDVSVLYFTVPFISKELEPTGTEQLWIFDIYGFVLAGLLITMGSLGDRIGRRRLLLWGAVAFGIASVAAAYAQNAETLIAARALLGVGGATLMPSTLALIRNMFHDDRQRSAAIGIWSSAMASGVALGPVLSGFLLDHFWWGSVFLANVPAMVLLLVLAPFLVPEFKSPAAGRFDLPGSLLSLVAVLPVIYGIKELAKGGADPVPVLCVAVGLAFGWLFLRRQRTARNPMIDLGLFRDRGFSGSIATNTLAMFGMAGYMIYTTQYLQSVLGHSPLEAALWCLIPSFAVAFAAPAATALSQRLDNAHVVAVGFLVAAAGLGTMSLVEPDSGVWLVLTAAGITSVGLIIVMATITDLLMASAPQEKAGAASALLETGQQFGGALGIAIMGSVGTAVYSGGMTDNPPPELTPAQVDEAAQALGNATAVAARLPEAAGEALLHTARAAFVDGLHSAVLTAAALLLAAAGASALLLRGVRGPGSGGKGEEEAGPAGEQPVRHEDAVV